MLTPAATQSRSGVKLDQPEFVSGGSYPWSDYLSWPTEKFISNNGPTYVALIGGLGGYSFASNLDRESQFSYHFLHDIAPSPIYPHVHWTFNVANATGVVRFEFEYTYARRAQAGAGTSDYFFTPVIVTVDHNVATTGQQLRHFVTELPDGIPAQHTGGNLTWFFC